MIKDYILKNLYAQAVDDATKECQASGENKAWAFEKYHVNAVLLEVGEVISKFYGSLPLEQAAFLLGLKDELAKHFYSGQVGEKKN